MIITTTFPISRFTKKLILPISFLFIVLFSYTCTAEVVDRIVAVVNEDVITLSELEEQGKVYFQQVRKNTPPESHREALQKARMEVLEGLIDSYLVAQKAKTMNIDVTPQEVDNTYDMMVSESGLSPEAFLAKLQLSGHIEKTYKYNIKNQILQSRLITQDVRSKIVITEKMLQDYYNKKYLQQNTTGGFYLLQMGFTWGKTSTNNDSKAKLYADKVDAQKRAERVLNLAQSGKDFKMLAKKFSDLPSAADGGDIGAFQEEEMAPFMREAVVGLRPGEISSIIETPAGFQFFKLLSTQDGSEANYEAVKKEIRDELYEQKLSETFEEWVKELRGSAYIRRM